MMSEEGVKLEFLSPAWLAMAIAETKAALADTPDGVSVVLKVVERFFDPPAGIMVPPEGEPGFVMEIAGGNVRARAEVLASDHGQFEVECPWIDAWRGATMRHGPALAAFNAWRIGAKRLKIRGVLPANTAFLVGVHDRMADRTLEPSAMLHPEHPLWEPAPA